MNMMLTPASISDAVALPAFAAIGTTTATNLASRTIASLRQNFAEIGHAPTPEMWTALQDVANTLERMAEGTADPVVYLSSLDPGVGKTSTVIHFIRALLASSAHTDVAVLVCVGRREQIEAIVQEAALEPADFAVLTSDERLNALGCGDANHARVLFTTHSMIEHRCEGRWFPEVSAFHYRGHVRAVRIWDEAILPGQALTIGRDDLAFLFKPLRGTHPELAGDVETLFTKLGEMEDGTILQVPDLAEHHGVSLNDALHLVDGGSADQIAAVEALWFLFGKMATVRRDGAYGNTMLDYRETLPEGIQPLLALDASARVRTAYDLWHDNRGGLVKLATATKSYDRHTIHIWCRSGGKSAFRKSGPELIEGIVETIRTRPDEEWLVIHHKNAGADLEAAVTRLLPGVRVHFVNWGRHDATNAFANVPNVILAGTLFYRTSHYEAVGRMASGRPSSTGPFPSSEMKTVMAGENSHLILQALCRGAVRRCVDGGCPETRTYIIASTRSGIPAALPRIFPGVRVLPWRPIQRPLSGKIGEAVAFIKERLEADPTATVTFADVRKHIGGMDASNFIKTVRQHPMFIETLAEEGIVECGTGRRLTGFKRLFEPI
ncbi:hypothetical protein [Blastochloris sulfoviridis]|uniref:DEAD/DEAH box helicase n=1 Tax=Blastochloris sulfoviridis TaxID=50712 RepID=A0A5M6I3T1_9HYPH|nr:hypothetical protein [Blastochloris sulfoviridis]KAA5602833.1 hypothetical protein F1193_03030 [Blastochloris sulfoviridis]